MNTLQRFFARSRLTASLGLAATILLYVLGTALWAAGARLVIPVGSCVLLLTVAVGYLSAMAIGQLHHKHKATADPDVESSHSPALKSQSIGLVSVLVVFCVVGPNYFTLNIPETTSELIYSWLNIQVGMLVMSALISLLYGGTVIAHTALSRAQEKWKWEFQRPQGLLETALAGGLISEGEYEELSKLQPETIAAPHPQLVDLWVKLLDHRKYIVRQKAAVQLRRASGQSFGFISNGLSGKRERAIKEWRAWFEDNRQRLADDWKSEWEKRNVRRKKRNRIIQRIAALSSKNVSHD